MTKKTETEDIEKAEEKKEEYAPAKNITGHDKVKYRLSVISNIDFFPVNATKPEKALSELFVSHEPLLFPSLPFLSPSFFFFFYASSLKASMASSRLFSFKRYASLHEPRSPAAC
jgi:hypothetical protein